ncbi:Anti-sigma-K factor rskA [Gillisia sp. Hel1_33_143]|uniref:anti-sigma factor n=1 Tax=Gillisia sp. Hel1_33_143 TaxID=1336796 RepID=UPI00087A2618|nr:anti-sigma factor [Gillisia sp. Hel1_33_143]SDS47161.1 Anti-sigma-K factor rskA [Gillisia sp. Hel1_33_143]
MEDINDYIQSGILELYVYGALTETESAEVAAKLREYPTVEEEVAAIEHSLMQLSSAAAPYNPEQLIASIKTKLGSSEKVIPITRKKSSLVPYLGWAASLLFLIGLFVLFNRNNELQNSVQALQVEKAQMESQIAEARNNTEKSQQLLAVLRDKNIIRVSLKGQQVAPDAYAFAYYNEENNKTYIDAKDLPNPPRGMVYQVWSLKMQPLTPVSIGLLDKFEDDDNKIFELTNENLSEGFGITLEPAGGSKTPTMEQLYTLGTVSST